MNRTPEDRLATAANLIARAESLIAEAALIAEREAEQGKRSWRGVGRGGDLNETLRRVSGENDQLSIADECRLSANTLAAGRTTKSTLLARSRAARAARA